nr:MAG TPA: hypothetical protein [Caudoviricetes sp.]
MRVNEKSGFCYVADALDKFLHYQTRYGDRSSLLYRSKGCACSRWSLSIISY